MTVTERVKADYSIEQFNEPIYYEGVESIEIIRDPDLNSVSIGLYPVKGFSIQNNSEIMFQSLPIASIDSGFDYAEIVLSMPSRITIQWNPRTKHLHIRGLQIPREQLYEILDYASMFWHRLS